MEKAMEAFSEIFEISLKPEDLEKQVEELLDWDSFTIMEFMVKISEKYDVTIDIVQISAIDTVKDVIELIYKCMV